MKTLWDTQTWKASLFLLIVKKIIKCESHSAKKIQIEGKVYFVKKKITGGQNFTPKELCNHRWYHIHLYSKLTSWHIVSTHESINRLKSHGEGQDKNLLSFISLRMINKISYSMNCVVDTSMRSIIKCQMSKVMWA